MKSVYVELEDVCSKEFDLETDLKTISINPKDRDEDLKYIYIFKQGPLSLPYFYIKKNNLLYNTTIPIEGNL